MLPGGRVSRQSQRVGGWCNLFSFKKTLIRHIEKISAYYGAKLKNMLELPFSFCVSKKPGEILIFRTFIAKFWMFWIFAYFLQISQFSRSGVSLWRHNYVTPWPIILILVCMNRGGPYLPIDTKINFIGGSVRKILRGCNNPPWLDVLQKIAWLDEG